MYEHNLSNYIPLKVCGDYRINLQKGTIINKDNRILKTRNGNRRYDVVSIKGKTYSLSRLVYAEKHGPVPEEMVIDHIDDDPSNNSIDNLQMITQQQNIVKSIPNRDHRFLKNNHIVCRERNIKATCLKDKTVKIYNSFYQCSRDLGINAGIIKMVCDKKKNCVSGRSKKNNNRYHFSYTKQSTTEDIPRKQRIPLPVRVIEHKKCGCGGREGGTAQGRYSHKRTKRHQSFHPSHADTQL